MFFYYLGPSALVFGLIRECYRQTNRGASPSTTTTTRQLQLPSQRAVLEARGIASFDIIAQAMNYTGAGLAGSSIFSIIYSSVTVWTAIWSRLFLQRTLSWTQWLAVWIVFGGLVIAGTHSTELGSDVMTGTLLVVVGSAMHGAVYVMGEALMNHGDPSDRL
jgi:drug/metabolite transporter (DMT)-like permease